jgi:hypothetical protein
MALTTLNKHELQQVFSYFYFLNQWAPAERLPAVLGAQPPHPSVRMAERHYTERN